MTAPFKLRPYQVAAIDGARRAFVGDKAAGIEPARAVIVTMPTGCHARGQAITLADYSCAAVEDIAVGDLLAGPDLQPRRVLALHRGRQAMVRIRPTDGAAPWEVNLDHVLTLAVRGTDPTKPAGWVDISVRDYLARPDDAPAMMLVRVHPAWRVHGGGFYVLPAGDQPKHPRSSVSGFTVEHLPEADFFGFEIDGDHRYLLGDGTVTHNSGKSVVFKAIAEGVAGRGRRVLLLVEGIKLVHQAAKHLREAGLTVGIEMAEHTAVPEFDLSKPQRELLGLLPIDEPGHFVKGPAVLSASILCERGMARKVKPADMGAGGWYVRVHAEPPQVVVASVDSLVNRLDRYADDAFRMVIVDECFPAGTMVDGRPIETIKVGDFVRAFNSRTRRIEFRPVVRLFKNPVRSLVRLHLSDGSSIVCTPEHPFAVCRGGRLEYILANQMEGHHVQNNSGPMQELRDSIRAPIPKDLLGEVPVGDQLADDVQNESGPRLASDEGAKPDGAAGDRGEDASVACGDRPHAADSGWQRPAGAGAPAEAGGCAGMADGGHRQDRSEEAGAAELLQDRHRQHGAHAGDRGGRGEPRVAAGPGGGRPEDGLSPGPRVDRVEVLEPGSDGRFGGVCGDGHVYNFEVDGLHNYFVNDILVHNCHHAVAPSYLTVFEHFGISVPKNEPKDDADLIKSSWKGDTLLFGLTATPDRGDKRDLMRLFGAVGYEYDIRTAIDDGWLVPIRQEFCHLEGLDLRKVRKSAGDLDARQLCELLEPLMVPICESIKQVSAGRPTLCYSPLCNLAESATQRLRLIEPDRQIHTITGETEGEQREEWFRGLDRGEVWALSSVGTLTEGVDLPRAAVAAMLRLTMSRLLYAQILGRVLRPAPEIAHALNDCATAEERRAMIAASSKPTATILDFAGNSGKHKLVRAVDILADEDDPAKQMAEMLMEKGETDPIAALEAARKELADMLEKARGKDIQRILVSPFDLLDVPQTKDAWGRPATDRQINALLEAGVIDYRKSFPKLEPHEREEAERRSREDALAKLRKMFDMTSASCILAERSRRIEEDMASPKQLRMLIKAGIPAGCARAMLFTTASAALDQLAAMSWKATPPWIERWSAARMEVAA